MTTSRNCSPSSTTRRSGARSSTTPTSTGAPRGVFLSIDRPDDIEAAFGTLGLGPQDVDLIVCSDAEAILGIGDWGVGGDIQISAGKLAVHTAAAGVGPPRVIPVSLDVGTDNEALLNDPLYLGNRHARGRGQAYDDFIARYPEAVSSLSRTRCCISRISVPATRAGSSTRTGASTASSTTTCRVPPPLSWPGCSTR